MGRHLAYEGGPRLIDELPKMFAHELLDTFEHIGGRDSSAQLVVSSLRQIAALRYVDAMADGRYDRAEQYAMALAKMPLTTA